MSSCHLWVAATIGELARLDKMFWPPILLFDTKEGRREEVARVSCFGSVVASRGMAVVQDANSEATDVDNVTDLRALLLGLDGFVVLAAVLAAVAIGRANW